MQEHLKECMLPAPLDGGFRMEGFWVWCGSVIKGEDGRYHMFASRWPKDVPMHPGWLLRSEVVRASADTPTGPFAFEEVVLGARGAQYWDGVATHNPHIKKIGDTYVLYYMGTTHPFPEHSDMEAKVIAARANKRIGIAVSKSVFGPWKRLPQPVLNTRPECFDSFLVSNPAPCVLEDGTVYLLYKARKYVENPDITWSDMMFGIAKAESYEGPYVPLTDTPVFASDQVLEDPYMWHDADGFHLIAKDMTGNVCGQHYGGVSAHSEDAVHWTLEKDVLSYSRDVLWEDGVTRRMGNLERPFILFEDGKATHMYFATSDGTEETGFVGCQNTWNMVIPLRQRDGSEPQR